MEDIRGINELIIVLEGEYEEKTEAAQDLGTRSGWVAPTDFKGKRTITRSKSGTRPRTPKTDWAPR